MQFDPTAMAGVVQHCRCGLSASAFKNFHGFLTHKGRCKEFGPAMQQVQQTGGHAAAEVPAWADDDVGEAAMGLSAEGDDLSAADGAAVAAEDDADATYVLGSRTDDLIGQLYRKHCISVSLLEDILRIARSGPATFRTARPLFRRIDALPGSLLNDSL